MTDMYQATAAAVQVVISVVGALWTKFKYLSVSEDAMRIHDIIASAHVAILLGAAHVLSAVSLSHRQELEDDNHRHPAKTSKSQRRSQV